MATDPLDELVVARRKLMIASEVRRILRAHRTIESADTIIARERSRGVQAQENVVVSMAILREVFGLKDSEISSLIADARLAERRRTTSDDDDDD